MRSCIILHNNKQYSIAVDTLVCPQVQLRALSLLPLILAIFVCRPRSTCHGTSFSNNTYVTHLTTKHLRRIAIIVHT